MSHTNAAKDYSAEDRMVRDYQIDSYASRQLALWALAHLGDRTTPEAYERLVVSLGRTAPDCAINKVYRDLVSIGVSYRSEAVERMFERFRIEGERMYPISSRLAA